MFKPAYLRLGAMLAGIGALLARDAVGGGGINALGPVLVAANQRYRRSREHTGKGTKAFQRAAAKRRNQRAAR